MIITQLNLDEICQHNILCSYTHNCCYVNVVVKKTSKFRQKKNRKKYTLNEHEIYPIEINRTKLKYTSILQIVACSLLFVRLNEEMYISIEYM